MNQHRHYCLRQRTPDHRGGWLAYLFLIICVLNSADRIVGQVQPLGIEELKSRIRSVTLMQVSGEIEQRGVSFALTEGVKTQLEKEVMEYHSSDDKGYRELRRVLEKKEPKEFIVAVTRFQGGNDRDALELQLAIEDRLRELGAPKNLLRVQPISVRAVPLNEQEAYQVGNDQGVHLVVWGDWRTGSKGETIFHPRIRVIHTHKETKVETGSVEERRYELWPLANLNVIDSGAIRTSNLIQILIALSYYKRAKYEPAAEILKKISEPDSEIYFFLGNCSYYDGRNKEAESYFEKAVQADQNSVKALHNFATILYLTGRDKEAIEIFKQALRIDPNSDKTLNNLGIALAETGEIEEGLRSIKKVTDINPGNANAWYNYGAVLYNANQTKPALDAFDHYLRLRPDDHNTWFLCAGLIRRSSDSDVEKAREFLLKAIEGNPQKGEYLEEFVRYIPLINDQKDLELYRRFYDRLPNIHFSKGSYRSIENLRRSIAARVSWLSVKLGQYREARKAVAGMKISQEELSNCDKKMIYKLVSVEMAAEKFKEPLRKTYYSTIFTHFFRWYYSAYPDPDMNPKPLLYAYEGLLRSQPSNLECLIGKGILQVEILGLPEERWISYGFVKPQLKPQLSKSRFAQGWAADFANNAEKTLKKAFGLTRDTALSHDLKMCIQKLRTLTSQVQAEESEASQPFKRMPRFKVNDPPDQAIAFLRATKE